MPEMERKDYIRWLGYVDVVRNGRWICYEWLGKRDHNGYGRYWLNGSWRQAHRISYQMISRRGRVKVVEREIPEDKPQLDHRCRNRACVRLEHLKPVTSKENHELRAAAYWLNKRRTTGGR